MESLNTVRRMSNGSECVIFLPSLPGVPVESVNLWHRPCPQSYPYHDMFCPHSIEGVLIFRDEDSDQSSWSEECQKRPLSVSHLSVCIH